MPIIVSADNASHELASFSYLFRIEDGVAILNRILSRWDRFHSDYDHDLLLDARANTDIRLESIETTFSFITMLFLMLGFYKGVLREVDRCASELGLDTTPLLPFPPETPAMAKLLTLRNKMVAHTADIEPRKDDTQPNRLAYLDWFVGYWGAERETRNRQLNAFSLSVGSEQSTHVVPPTFAQIVADVQTYINICDERLSRNCNYLVEQVKSSRPKGFLFVGYYPA